MAFWVLFLISLSAYGADSGIPCPQGDLGELDSVANTCLKSTSENFENSLPNAKKNNVFYSYTLAMSPSQSDRLHGIDEQQNEALATLKHLDPSITDLYGYLSKVADSSPSYSLTHAAKFDQFFDKQLVPQRKNIDGMKVVGSYDCGSADSQCRSAFSDLVDEMQPSDGFGTLISLPSVWKEIGTDPRYIKPLAKFAVDLRKKVDLARTGRLSAVGDLFTDLKNEFISSGASVSDATDMTWKALAFYATRGASAMPYFAAADKENKAAFVSTALIASMISYLDGYSLKSGKLYSLPSTVQTSCDYTRPYHFWMAGYLARELLKKGFSKSASFKATHLSETVYEQFSTAYTKERPDEVAASTTHNFYNVETQKNILFNDAGAYSALSPGKQINLDTGFREMYSSAKQPTSSVFQSLLGSVSDTLKNLTGFDLGTITKWNSIISPDSAYTPMASSL